MDSCSPPRRPTLWHRLLLLHVLHMDRFVYLRTTLRTQDPEHPHRVRSRLRRNAPQRGRRFRERKPPADILPAIPRHRTSLRDLFPCDGTSSVPCVAAIAALRHHELVPRSVEQYSECGVVGTS